MINESLPPNRPDGLVIDLGNGTMEEAEVLMRLYDKFKPQHISGHRKAKELALEAAIKLVADKTLDLTGAQLTGVAETIYRWLIKKDENG